MNIHYPVLAIDYGKKHFGIAYSDSNGTIASPLPVLHITKNRGEEDIIQEVHTICEEYRIKSVLVGIPASFTTKHIQNEKRIGKFIEKLKNVITLPIYTYDESFSTLSAQNMLTSLGTSVKRSRKKIDSIAATVFLQEFLNSKQKNHNEKQYKIPC